MTVINNQNGIRLSGLPSLSDGQNASIQVHGLQNALLRGDSGSFSLTLVLEDDESRHVDKCQAPNRAIWAPDQESLSNLICPASFYSDTLLKQYLLESASVVVGMAMCEDHMCHLRDEPSSRPSSSVIKAVITLRLERPS